MAGEVLGPRPASAPSRPSAFQDMLLGLRAAANETRDDLATAIGVSVETIKTYERRPSHASARTPPAEVFRRLCAHFRERGVLSPEQFTAFAAARAARRRRQGAAPPTSPRTPWSLTRVPTPVLPRRLTTLIGRGELVAHLCSALQGEEGALVTLIGPGGIGKTHLALEVAHRLRAAFPQGVRFVDLAPVASAADVASAVAAQLGVQEPPALTPRDRLLAWLADKALLLVLDNFEHVLDAAPLVSDMLAHAPGLTVLATSRAPLHLHGEQERTVPPLDPADARRLFVRRVRDTLPDFRRTEENAAAIDAICERLDGIPLALELAARQLQRYGTPAALLAALEPALPRLGDGPRDAPARQQTMRNAIAWSDALLSSEAQWLFRQLSVCRGGCTVAAARVLGENRPHLETSLAALSAHGLVQRTAQQQGKRLRLFEVVREYGQERLDELGEADAARRRHAGYYLALAEEADSYYQTPQQAHWDRVLAPDRENVWAVLEWATGIGDGLLALRLILAVWRHCERRGLAAEAARWVERALALAPNAPDEVRAQGLYAAARLLALTNEYAACERVHEQCAALVERLGDRALRGALLNSWGGLAYRQGDFGRAIRLHTEALELLEELDDASGIAEAHLNLGIVSLLQWAPGDAEAHYARAAAALRDMGDTRGYALARFGLGVARSMLFDWPGALIVYREVLTLARRLRDVDVLIYVVHGIAAVAGLTGDPERAARLFGAGVRLCEETGVDLPPSYRVLVETTLGMVRQAMPDPRAFDVWYGEGKALSLADTLALARRCVQATRG